MKKSNQIIVAALGAVFIFSISFQLKVNRYLRSATPQKEAASSASEERTVGNFNRISVSDGIEVYFSQDTITTIKVEVLNDNLSKISTNTKGGELFILRNEKVTNSGSIRVFISNKELTALKANSGAYFETVGGVFGEHLDLEFSSDTKAQLDLSYSSVKCKAASGSEIKFKGNTSNIEFTN